MAYRFSLDDLTVECDTWEELLIAKTAVTGQPIAFSTGGPPQKLTKWDRLRAYAAKHNVSIAEAREAISKEEPPKGKQGVGPKKGWEKARKYAEKHGCTLHEARRILAEERRKRIEQAETLVTAKLAAHQ